MRQAQPPVTAASEPTEFLEVHLSTPPTDADRLARALIEARVAACVQTIPGVQSTYRWEGAIETSEEVLLIAKTTRLLFPRLAQLVTELHPYAVPEIVALPLVALAEPYAQWLRDAVSDEQ